MGAELEVNGERRTLRASPDTPLLWVIRDELGLTGTKYGCGIAQCGACTVHVDGQAVRSCITPLSAVMGRSVRTIEGLSDHPVQRAWVAEQAPQCGYCQSGQIMSAAAAHDEGQDLEGIERAMHGVLCRCGSYPRIARALRRLEADR